MNDDTLWSYGNPEAEWYFCRYRYQGKEWVVDILADNVEDAQARLQAMALGRVEGVIVGKAPDIMGPLAGLIIWVQVQWRHTKKWWERAKRWWG